MRQRGLAPSTRGAARAKRTLPLAATGIPAVAIVWKNTLLLMRTGRVGAVVGLGAMSVIFSLPVAERSGLDARFVAACALMMALLLFLLGSRVLQNDLRQDVEHLAALKTLPLRGAHLVGAEVLSSTLPIAGMQLVLIVLAYVALLGVTFPLPLSTRTLLVLMAPVVLIAMNATTVTIQNAAAVLFPGWVRGGTPGGGVEAMGQGILATIVLLVTFLVALLPASIVFAAVLWGLAPIVPFAWLPALLAAATALAGESWLVIRRLGVALERMEPSQTT